MGMEMDMGFSMGMVWHYITLQVQVQVQVKEQVQVQVQCMAWIGMASLRLLHTNAIILCAHTHIIYGTSVIDGAQRGWGLAQTSVRFKLSSFPSSIRGIIAILDQALISKR